MKIEEMSDVTKEKHAEFSLKFSSNLITAFFITIVLGPLSVILGLILSPESMQPLSLSNFIQAFSGWQGLTFIVFESAAILLSIFAQDHAYKIYNDLYPNKVSNI